MSLQSRITDALVAVAGQVNLLTAKGDRFLIHNTGRWYMNTNLQWVTAYDDQYGTSYYQNAEGGGSGANPVAEYEHQGAFIPSGSIINSMYIMGRANNSTELEDIEYSLDLKTPDPISRFETGYDSDSEDTHVELVRDLWMNTTNDGQTVFTNPITDIYRRKYEIDHTVTEDSFLALYMRPIDADANMTAKRYFYGQHVFDITLPPL